MTTVVEVILSVTVAVDADYPPAEHATDIIAAVRTLFCASAVNVIGANTKEEASDTPMIRQVEN